MHNPWNIHIKHIDTRYYENIPHQYNRYIHGTLSNNTPICIHITQDQSRIKINIKHINVHPCPAWAEDTSLIHTERLFTPDIFTFTISTKIYKDIEDIPHTPAHYTALETRYNTLLNNLCDIRIVQRYHIIYALIMHALRHHNCVNDTTELYQWSISPQIEAWINPHGYTCDHYNKCAHTYHQEKKRWVALMHPLNIASNIAQIQHIDCAPAYPIHTNELCAHALANDIPSLPPSLTHIQPSKPTSTLFPLPISSPIPPVYNPNTPHIPNHAPNTSLYFHDNPSDPDNNIYLCGYPVHISIEPDKQHHHHTITVLQQQSLIKPHWNADHVPTLTPMQTYNTHKILSIQECNIPQNDAQQPDISIEYLNTLLQKRHHPQNNEKYNIIEKLLQYTQQNHVKMTYGIYQNAYHPYNNHERLPAIWNNISEVKQWANIPQIHPKPTPILHIDQKHNALTTYYLPHQPNTYTTTWESKNFPEYIKSGPVSQHECIAYMRKANTWNIPSYPITPEQ